MSPEEFLNINGFKYSTEVVKGASIFGGYYFCDLEKDWKLTESETTVDTDSLEKLLMDKYKWHKDYSDTDNSKLIIVFTVIFVLIYFLFM